MKQVRKTVIKLTVLSEEGGIGPTDCTLEEIAREMDTGCFLGSWNIESSTILSADAVEDECATLNNDGTFFADDE